MLDFKASATLNTPSSPIWLWDKLVGVKFNWNNTDKSSVKVLLDFKAFATDTAPSEPILLLDKLVWVRFKIQWSQIKEKI